MIVYAISDPSALDKRDPQSYLKRAKAKGANWFLYRDKNNFNYMYDAPKVLQTAIDLGFERVVVHRDIWLAHRLEAQNVHLTSAQFEEVSRAKDLGLYTIVSTHSLEEALRAQELGADIVTLGPVFPTKNKPNPIGLESLRAAKQSLYIAVIALGGITDEERVQQVKACGADGFASIGYFA